VVRERSDMESFIVDEVLEGKLVFGDTLRPLPGVKGTYR
jgi:hypothetical protein